MPLMARVVVIGGGFGGMATAARLAKLGHDVTVLEQDSRMGGALSSVEQDGFTWDAGPTSTLVPSVIRDLFRKSGRVLEAELGTDLVPLPLIREHRFPDRTHVALPPGRAGQYRAWEGLASGLGGRWVGWVESFADDWDVIRRRYAEVPWNRVHRRTPEARELLARLDSRRTVHRETRATFNHPWQRLAAGHPFLDGGHDPRHVPAWCGVVAYLEQRFGAWHLPGGMWQIGTALHARMSTRQVEVVTDCKVHDVVIRDGRAVGVATAGGDCPADVVVTAVDPRHLPALAPHVARTRPTTPPVVTHLGLVDDLPAPAHESVWHGDPSLVVRTGGRAPEGHLAWTVHGRTNPSADLLELLAERGLDLRGHVVSRLDRTPEDQIAQWGGSPYGVQWRGRRTVRDRLGPDTPVPGVYAAGAHATPGAGLPFVGLSASLVAQRIGPA